MAHDIYIRHGEDKHTIGEKVGDDLLELTPRGYEEARQISSTLRQKRIDFSKTTILTKNNVRSVSTAIIALMSYLTNGEEIAASLPLMQQRRLFLTKGLGYTKFSDDEQDIRQKFDTAYTHGRTMEFYVRESDVLLKRNPRLSTYSTLAGRVAALALAEPTYKQRLICANEFFWPSFRAKSLELTKGLSVRDDYVEWYMENKELNPAARLDIATIIKLGDVYSVQDDYGHSEVREREIQYLSYGAQ